MRITDISLRNFGPFENLNLPFSVTANPAKDVTVFIGNNGSGKSSILEAVTILMSWFIARFRSDKTPGSPIPELKIHGNAAFSDISLSLLDSEREYYWDIVRTRPGRKRQGNRLN